MSFAEIAKATPNFFGPSSGALAITGNQGATVSIDAYKNHPVWTTVDELLKLQSDPSLSEPSIGDVEQHAFARDKVFAMAQMLRSLLESAPATLVSTHALNQINKQLNAVLSEARAFVGNKNPGHITNAVNNFEQNVMPLLWGLALSSRAAGGEAVATLLEGLSRSSSETIRRLSQERDQLTTRIQETESVAQDLKVRLEAMSESAARERAEASAAVAKLEQAFTLKETERAAAFEVAVGKFKSDYSAVETNTKGEAAKFIAELEAHRDNAAKIVQVVGNIGVTGNYQRIANDEASQANFWRWTTVGFFGAGVLLAAATFYRYWGQPVSIESVWSIAIRLLYAIAITAPAWYTAKESARHRTNSDRARQTELELASLGPFIELMPPEKKIEIREKMTAHYFGKEVDTHTAKGPLDVQTIKELAIELAKAFRK